MPQRRLPQCGTHTHKQLASTSAFSALLFIYYHMIDVDVNSDCPESGLLRILVTRLRNNILMIMQQYYHWYPWVLPQKAEGYQWYRPRGPLDISITGCRDLHIDENSPTTVLHQLLYHGIPVVQSGYSLLPARDRDDTPEVQPAWTREEEEK